MKVRFHPRLADDVRRIAAQYGEISAGLEARFRQEFWEAIEKIKAEPIRAGHFLNTGSSVIKEFRRRNLVSFPFFVLYGVLPDELIIGALIASRSDPLTWLLRFSKPRR